MNIILLGYMGCGKSVIGSELAVKLGLKFIDLDSFIEDNEQQSISNIFKDKGDIYFRNIETIYLNKILDDYDNIVLSLGGGTPCYNDNMNTIISSNNQSFYLKNSNIQLSKRLFIQKKFRPIISEIKTEEKMIEFVSKHLFERERFYSKSSYVIDCNKETFDSVCKSIISKLN
tara:strand:- start:307 stop:825 length:519 start_codon:yes stop_codon:yes gene_type:complete